MQQDSLATSAPPRPALLADHVLTADALSHDVGRRDIYGTAGLVSVGRQ